jgi:hypothetical protein
MMKIPQYPSTRNRGGTNSRGPRDGIHNIHKPVKTQKVNIGTEESPKFAQIGDYWDEETIEKIAYLLRMIPRPIPNYILRDERDSRRARGDENPTETRC